MDRFIERYSREHSRWLKNLKSSMDRFIVDSGLSTLVPVGNLKSSMDRFIGLRVNRNITENII